MSTGDFDATGANALAVTVLVTKAGLDAAGAVLGRVCLPAAKELGLLFQDKVTEWRAGNFISTMRRLEQMLSEKKIPDGAHAPPRIVHSIVEQASWVEDAFVQEMWAGLVASSCTEKGDDDSNLIFVNLLSDLTRLQVRILKFACETSKPSVAPAGVIWAGPVIVRFEKLCTIAEENDLHRLDREMDYLRDVGLLEFRSGFPPMYSADLSASITPSPLALHMYVRCQGSRASPLDFFKLPQPQAGAPEAPKQGVVQV